MKSNKVLPDKYSVHMINADLHEAVCGSPKHCTIAVAIGRQLPAATFVKVNVNRVTITYNGILHHYSLPDKALKLVAQNDDGSLSLGTDRRVTLSLISRRKAYVDLSPERKAGIRQSEADRKAAGTLKNYSRNVRSEAARRAGRLRKKLIVQAQQKE